MHKTSSNQTAIICILLAFRRSSLLISGKENLWFWDRKFFSWTSYQRVEAFHIKAQQRNECFWLGDILPGNLQKKEVIQMLSYIICHPNDRIPETWHHSPFFNRSESNLLNKQDSRGNVLKFPEMEISIVVDGKCVGNWEATEEQRVMQTLTIQWIINDSIRKPYVITSTTVGIFSIYFVKLSWHM